MSFRPSKKLATANRIRSYSGNSAKKRSVSPKGGEPLLGTGSKAEENPDTEETTESGPLGLDLTSPGPGETSVNDPVAGETLGNLDSATLSGVLLELWKKDRKYAGIFEIIISPQNLAQAWAEIKGHPGNMTPGTDGETLDGISAEKIEQIHNQLKDRSYKYKALRRVNIPKPNKPGESRPLCIASPRDKIVQQAFKRVLEVVYEGIRVRSEVSEEEFLNTPVGYGNKFTRTSGGIKRFYVAKEALPTIFDHQVHGFRPNRSCHTALTSIKKSWKDVNWFINVDIRKAFDKVNHDILCKIIGERVADQRVVEELRKMAKVNIVDLREEWKAEEGTAQGNIVSPLLFNVYMTRLDNHVEKLQMEYNRAGGKKISNSQFRSAT